MACLDLQRTRFSALDLLAGLDPLAACSDREALLRQVPRPREPKRLAAIDQAQGPLEKIRLLQLAGRPRETAPLLEQQRARVELADWGPLIAAFLASEGLQRIREDQPAQGHRLFKRAFTTAISIGDDSLARATLGDYHEAQAAAAELLLGHHAEAVAQLDRGERYWARALGPDHLNFLEARSLRGVIARDTGDLASARAAFEHVLAVKRENVGPDGEQTLATELELGLTLAALGELEQALVLAKRVLEQRLRRVAPDHSSIGATLVSLATIEGRAGELEQAHAHAREAEAMLRAVHDPTHPKLAALLELRATLEPDRGDLDKVTDKVTGKVTD